MDKYKKMVADILQRAATDLGKMEHEIEKARAELASADAAMMAAGEKGDSHAYIKAQSDASIAKAWLEECEKRADSLRSGTLIRKEEYDALVKSILQGMGAADRASKAEVVKLCEQARAIVDSNQNMINEGNDLLTKLQRDIYRYADCKKDRNGEPIRTANSIKAYKDNASLTAWKEYALDSVQYGSIVNSMSME